MRWMVVTAVALAIAACGTEADVTTNSETAGSASTTVGSTLVGTTTTVPSTTPPSTSPPSTSTTVAPTSTMVDTNAMAEFDGCTPGTDEGLPDGEWFGLVVAADPDGIDFDLACLFFGDAATVAAAEDGEESPPPNDYHIRNLNPLLRTLEVAADARVVYYETGDPASDVELDYDAWLASGYEPGSAAAPPGGIRVVITVDEGVVTSVAEFWTP